MFSGSHAVRRKVLIAGMALVGCLTLLFIGYHELHHNYYEAITVTADGRARDALWDGLVPVQCETGLGWNKRKVF